MNTNIIVRFVCVAASSCLLLIVASTASYACSESTDCPEVDLNPCTVPVCIGGLCQEDACPLFVRLPCRQFVCQAGVGCINATPPDTTCDDGDPCTTQDICISGDCEGGPFDPTCNAPCTTGSCDDDDPCTLDECLGSGDCTHTAIVLDDTQCLQPREASFRLRDRDNDSDDEATWEWNGGDAFNSGVLGTPGQDTRYSLCIYDYAADVPHFVGSFAIAPGTNWKDKGSKGWRYRDRSRSSDGVEKLSLETGRAGKSEVEFRAKGVDMPTLAPLGNQYFAEDPWVVVQLVNSEGSCWSSRFTANGTKKNRPHEFRAKTDADGDSDSNSDRDSDSHHGRNRHRDRDRDSDSH